MFITCGPLDHKNLIRGHYDTLEVARSATTDTIRQAFKARALITHPDKPGGTAEAFRAVLTAFHILSDYDLRARYDAECQGNGNRDGTGRDRTHCTSAGSYATLDAAQEARKLLEVLRFQ